MLTGFAKFLKRILVLNGAHREARGQVYRSGIVIHKTKGQFTEGAVLMSR